MPHGVSDERDGRHIGAALSRLRLTRTGLAPWLVAGAGGLALAAAFPPIRIWPVVFLAPMAWIVSLALDQGRRPFRLGMALGVVAYAPMLSWIVEPAGWLAWVLLVLLQAGFIGVAGGVVRPWLHHPLLPAIAALAWTGADLVRSHVPLSGFEWGALQYAHADGSWMLPLARIAGGRAVTFMTVFLAVAVVQLALVALAEGPQGAPVDERLRVGLTRARLPAALLLAGLLVSTLVTVEPPAPNGIVLDVLVAQGNDIEDTESSAAEEDRMVASNLLALTEQELASGPLPDLVVWPENALDRDPWAPEGRDLVPIKDRAGAITQGRLLAGVNRVGPRERTFLNSQVLIGADGSVIDQYHKQHYVPFGEYVPMRSVLGGFPPLRAVPRDGIPVVADDTIHVGPARIAVGICFESLFGSLIRHNIRAGDEDANVVVMSTSDSTFGRTGEPEQHLSQSRMRAVESGRWIIHAASSGVSTLIAPDGSVGERTELFTQATQRLDVPLVDEPTPWLRWGNVLDVPLAVGLLFLPVAAARRSRRERLGHDGE